YQSFSHQIRLSEFSDSLPQEKIAMTLPQKNNSCIIIGAFDPNIILSIISYDIESKPLNYDTMNAKRKI
ncbi:hypothetical protein, partial [Dorea sp. 210702-DFI.3.17]|uniref:hypothetical protein n=1 Tax=Dorea sp. 210702-DFI.3.17 TaxID=2883208 RepID=UPI001D06F6B0